MLESETGSAVQVLDLLLEYFGEQGERWTRDRYDDGDGRRCLVGAPSAPRPQACTSRRVIPEIDIWRAANLMLERYGDKAVDESAARADEPAAAGDNHGAPN